MIAERRGRTTGGDVAASEGHAARVADEVQPAEVVRLAQRVLLAILGLDRKELCSHNLVAVLRIRRAEAARRSQQNKVSFDLASFSRHSQRRETHLAPEAVEMIHSLESSHERPRAGTDGTTLSRAGHATTRATARTTSSSDRGCTESLTMTGSRRDGSAGGGAGDPAGHGDGTERGTRATEGTMAPSTVDEGRHTSRRAYPILMLVLVLRSDGSDLSRMARWVRRRSRLELDELDPTRTTTQAYARPPDQAHQTATQTVHSRSHCSPRRDSLRLGCSTGRRAHGRTRRCSSWPDGATAQTVARLQTRRTELHWHF
jgi:hypothetical protein